jgi:predicted GIY-YIG superfamily endonuclease
MIDGCDWTFDELAAVVLPETHDAPESGHGGTRRLQEFCMRGIGIKTILQRLGRSCDFSGCYVLMDKTKPIYVGISRGVIARLRQHVNGRTHFDASLAYLMACKDVPHTLERGEAMNNDRFLDAFHKAQQLHRESSVAFIEISNALELYLFEAYCAMVLDTSEWNSFQTH